LQPATPLEILAHRIVWSLVFILVVICITRKQKVTLEVFRDRRSLSLLTVAAVLIAINWGVFIWASVSGHILDSSLGYYITPLVSVALGVVVFKEKLRSLQWLALGIAAISVVYLATAHGKFPFVAVILSMSFGIYGYVKKFVGIDAIESLAVETAVLAPFAFSYICYLSVQGNNSFTNHGAAHALWLSSSGVVTAVPLLLFGAAAVRIPLSLLGILQYVGPTMQFIVGIWIFHEAMPHQRFVGFLLTWVALIILTADSLHHQLKSSSKVVS
jgi:chloramphenicol-sensitive protein RarD